MLPALLEDDYRIVVRTDVYNHVWEDEYEINNTTRSPDAISTRVDEMFVDAPLSTTIGTGQERLYRIVVGKDQTLRVQLSSTAEDAMHELFVRHEGVPTGNSTDSSGGGR